MTFATHVTCGLAIGSLLYNRAGKNEEKYRWVLAMALAGTLIPDIGSGTVWLSKNLTQEFARLFSVVSYGTITKLTCSCVLWFFAIGALSARQLWLSEYSKGGPVLVYWAFALSGFFHAALDLLSRGSAYWMIKNGVHYFWPYSDSDGAVVHRAVSELLGNYTYLTPKMQGFLVLFPGTFPEIVLFSAFFILFMHECMRILNRRNTGEYGIDQFSYRH